jgi:peptidoglycan/xylan/chitin deacetylase (PgdA/CDA1 family)
MSWLDAVRRALDERPDPCLVFFRDDDAGRDDGRLAAMLDRFEAHRVGVDVAVIPALVRRSLASAFQGRMDAGGVRLHQHGLAHVNHESTGRKHEFGPSRDQTRQSADVATGRRILLDWFGERALDPVFTPPWNRCTPATGRALLANGLRVLSRDHTAPPLGLPGLAEVPVTVDWFGHRKGVRFTPVELAAELADQVRGGDPIGVMLHHAVTDADELARVDELLALAAQHPAVRVASIGELAGVTAVGNRQGGGT